MVETMRWTKGRLDLLDQTLLPEKVVYRPLRTAREVTDAIRNMLVRGAPAIGVTAAFGMALAARNAVRLGPAAFHRELVKGERLLAGSRPTAVNLFWALARMRRLIEAVAARPPREIAALLEAEAVRILEEDIAINRAMGRHGAALIADGDVVLTHCNAGALATAGFGTALGVIRAAWEAGKKISVLADETRPRCQGAKLTAWELSRDGIPVTVIADTAAGHFLRKGAVQKVVVGADRIAANGDVANKIGTYQVAVLAARQPRAVLRGRPREHVRPGPGGRRRDPDRGARRLRGHPPRRPAVDAARRPGAQPGVRRDPGALRERHHHRARGPDGALPPLHRAVPRRGA